MLAIIWALQIFYRYLYGEASVKIFTDHQPLTYALSRKNQNTKMKRWKAALVEFNYELIYKPGKANVVADMLSRIPTEKDNLNNIDTISMTQHSAESSPHNLTRFSENPLNLFKNQIRIQKDTKDSYKFHIPFPTFHRHLITIKDLDSQALLKKLKQYLNPSVSIQLKPMKTL